MVRKRLTVELPVEQYEFLRTQAIALGNTVSGLIRAIIEERRRQQRRAGGRRDYRSDPLYRRRGSFAGPSSLSGRHDEYLYPSGYKRAGP